jgi:syntaxin 5
MNQRGFNHAVSRSSELIACAKTSWKIQQQQEQQRHHDPSVPSPPPIGKPPDYRLASPNDPAPSGLSMLEDGLTLLRAMEYGLKQLQVLVRRRGHTNDPTEEIATLVKQLEQDTQELTEFCQQLLAIRRRKQAKRHWELVVQWFQQVADHYSTQLQVCLKLRGEILTEQAQQRRKLVDTKAPGAAAAAVSNGSKKASTFQRKHNLHAGSTATPLFDSPLFTASSPRKMTTSKPPVYNGNTHGGPVVPPPPAGVHRNYHTGNGNHGASQYYGSNHPTPPVSGYGGGNHVPPSANASFGYGGYGGSGYGGGMAESTGMRQRKGGMLSTTTMSIPAQELQEEEEKVHNQIQMRQQKRETQQRLDEARQAETMLGELGQLFGKMSTLITQQGETLEKIEDDVECALGDVTAGQEELTKLYSIKKGNRPLIIKTFLILNFLIIFMKAYSRK